MRKIENIPKTGNNGWNLDTLSRVSGTIYNIHINDTKIQLFKYGNGKFVEVDEKYPLKISLYFRYFPCLIVCEPSEWKNCIDDPHGSFYAILNSYHTQLTEGEYQPVKSLSRFTNENFLLKRHDFENKEFEYDIYVPPGVTKKEIYINTAEKRQKLIKDYDLEPKKISIIINDKMRI
ncbi:MAG: hypothetical protein WBA74_17310 [Cyclobacteriaceae bacterium]